MNFSLSGHSYSKKHHWKEYHSLKVFWSHSRETPHTNNTIQTIAMMFGFWGQERDKRPSHKHRQLKSQTCFLDCTCYFWEQCICRAHCSASTELTSQEVRGDSQFWTVKYKQISKKTAYSHLTWGWIFRIWPKQIKVSGDLFCFFSVCSFRPVQRLQNASKNITSGGKKNPKPIKKTPPKT